MQEKIVGVVGGMGPEATAAFYTRLVSRTPASRDQDHLHVIIDGDAKIPDRTESILTGSSVTLDAIVASAHRLEQAGAQLLAMPCNSAHYWYDEIVSSLRIPLLNLPGEVFRVVHGAALERVGLLTTTGSARSGLYPRYAGSTQLLLPDDRQQDHLQSAIYAVKGTVGERLAAAKARVLEIAASLRGRGAEGIILGCTELPLLVAQADMPDLPLFDSTDVLVDAVLREALAS
jgi:aspartate racemase